jgi:hypothetical protein
MSGNPASTQRLHVAAAQVPQILHRERARAGGKMDERAMRIRGAQAGERRDQFAHEAASILQRLS